MDDPECDGPGDDEFDDTSTCDPVIGIPSDDEAYPNDPKTAFYDSTTDENYNPEKPDSATDCYYREPDFDVSYNGIRANVFTCNGNGTISDAALVLDKDAAETYCAEQVTDTAIELHGGSMPMVEYFVPKSAIPLGFNRYATKNGFKNKFYMSLHEAERRYAPNCEEIFSAQQCFDYAQDTSKTYIHQVETWEEVGMTNLEGYRNDNPENYINAWTTANATSSTTNAIESKGQTLRDRRVFDGGFGGKCDSGRRWTYSDDTSRWECSGAVEITQEVYFPNNLRLGGSVGNNVGFYIMPYFFRNGPSFVEERISFREALNNAPGASEAVIDEVHAACWSGGVSDKPSASQLRSSSNAFTLKLSVDKSRDSIYDPVPVYGNLELKEGDTQYTCQWGFLDSNGNFWDDAGSLEKLNGNELSQRFDSRPSEQADQSFKYEVPSGEQKSVFRSQNLVSTSFKSFAEAWSDVGSYTHDVDINDDIDGG